MRTTFASNKLSSIAVAATLAVLSCAALAQPPRFDRIVSFGASLSDTGNAFVWLSEPANQHCGTSLNTPPYDALDELKIPDGPYATGGHHFTNGATWLEGMARDLSLAGNVRPALASGGPKASNYAVGGARAVAGYPCRYNLPAQIAAYLTDFPQTSPKTLVTIEIGGNDVRDALAAAGMGEDPTAYIGNALASLGNGVGTLYAYGARQFLLMNVPDLGKLPAVRGLGPAAVFGGGMLSAAYNANLGELRDYLAAVLPGSDIRILDAYSKLNDVVANPAAYGLANVTDACVTPGVPPFKCKKPDTCLFWDGIHPTKVVHEVLAREAIGVVAAP
jgi:phospholipase/lecithinase/hemolysin